MAKFTVMIKEVHVVEVEVEAASPDDARDAAEELLASGELGEAIYHYTLSSYEWPVLPQNA